MTSINEPSSDQNSISYSLIQIWNIIVNDLRTKANINVELYPSQLLRTWKSNVCRRCRNKFDSTALVTEKIIKLGEEPVSGNSISCHNKALRFILPLFGFLWNPKHTQGSQLCVRQSEGDERMWVSIPGTWNQLIELSLNFKLPSKAKLPMSPTGKLLFEYLLECDMK